MIKRSVYYKGNVFCEIMLDDRDEDIADKRWHLNFTSFKVNRTRNYFRIMRTARKADKHIGTARIKLHQEVWHKHKGPLPPGMTIDHIDFNTLNNQMSNLRLLTRSENSKHKQKRKKTYEK